MNERVWTIKDIISWSIPFLKEKGSPSARLDAEIMLAQVMACRRLDLYLDHHKPLTPDERRVFRESIRRRAAGEPVAYIIGQREFFGLNFEVNSATLIPRPETEHLVEKILETYPPTGALRGLDIGTGSGCIAITLKQQRSDWQIEAWDFSDEALEVAARNVQRHGIEINLQRLDALQQKTWQGNSHCFDFIVSNPPYIATSERAGLPISVLNYEPSMALFAENSGLAFYEAFASYAGFCLVPGGKIFLEIGSRQAADVCLLMESKNWQKILVHQDLAGHDRVIEAERPQF